MIVAWLLRKEGRERENMGKRFLCDFVLVAC